MVRRLVPVLAVVLVVGCVATGKYDSRLNGVWRLSPTNREPPHLVLSNDLARLFPAGSTVPLLYQMLTQDLNLESVRMAFTFSNNLERISFDGRMGEFRPYRVLEKGPNHVLIERLYGAHSRVRFDFGDGGRTFWLRESPGYSLRFEKSTEPDAADNPGQPGGSETNGVSGADGAGG